MADKSQGTAGGKSGDSWNRQAGGRFGPGNRGGGVTGAAAKAGHLRRKLFEAETPERVKQVVEALFVEATQGNVAAAKEYLDRVIGPAKAFDVLERLEQLEHALDGELTRERKVS